MSKSVKGSGVIYCSRRQTVPTVAVCDREKEKEQQLNTGSVRRWNEGQKHI